MKILFIASGIVGDKPGISGGETRFLEIAKIWQKQGHEIHLLAPAGAKTLLKEWGLNKVKLHIATCLKSKGRWVFVFLFLRYLFSLPKSLRNLHPDIIRSTSEQIYDVWPALKIKRRNPKARWSAVVHWLPPWPVWKRSSSQFWNSLFFFVAERLGLTVASRWANILLPVSFATARQLEGIGIKKDRYRTVECGVNYGAIQKICRRVKSKRYEGVFLKRLQLSKGVLDLIYIWQKVVIQLPQAKLLVIGSGIDEQKAKAVVKRLCLEKNIIFVGAIHNLKEKFTYLSQSKIFLLPTHEENWAISVGEAMAAGLPVIAYDLKELREVWQDAFWPVPKGNLVYFSRAICTLLKNPQKSKALAQKGKEYVKRYDWQKIAKEELKYILDS